MMKLKIQCTAESSGSAFGGLRGGGAEAIKRETGGVPGSSTVSAISQAV